MSAAELVSTVGTRRDALSRPLAGWLNGTLILVAFIGIVWLERKRPLRRRIENEPHHDARNLAMSVLTAAAIRVAEKPLMDRLTHLVQRKQWGLVKRVHLPPALEVVVAVVLLDYTLYVWHVLTHVVPFLWRFHRVHHADLDLTASTALRFHFAEMVLSVPWRAGQVPADRRHTTFAVRLADGHTTRDHVPPLQSESASRCGTPTLSTGGNTAHAWHPPLDDAR